jgi:hypothetical protein
LPDTSLCPAARGPGPPNTNLFVPAWLGAQFAPFATGGEPRKPDFKVDAVSLPDDVSADRFAGRTTLRGRIEAGLRVAEKADGLAELDRLYGKAVELLTSPRVRRAFDLHAEPAPVRERYGDTKLGQRCLLARRLLDAGARFVMVDYGYDWGEYNNLWDNHCAPVQNQPHISKMAKLPYHLPAVDRAFSAVLDDLAQRGRLERTLVVYLTEFGRTPKINKEGGRDHWGYSGSSFYAGGGVKGGQVIGATDKVGGYCTTRTYSPADAVATVYRAVGIDPHTPVLTRENRPVGIQTEGEPIPVFDNHSRFAVLLVVCQNKRRAGPRTRCAGILPRSRRACSQETAASATTGSGHSADTAAAHAPRRSGRDPARERLCQRLVLLARRPKPGLLAPGVQSVSQVEAERQAMGVAVAVAREQVGRQPSQRPHQGRRSGYVGSAAHRLQPLVQPGEPLHRLRAGDVRQCRARPGHFHQSVYLDVRLRQQVEQGVTHQLPQFSPRRLVGKKLVLRDPGALLGRQAQRRDRLFLAQQRLGRQVVGQLQGGTVVLNRAGLVHGIQVGLEQRVIGRQFTKAVADGTGDAPVQIGDIERAFTTVIGLHEPNRLGRVVVAGHGAFLLAQGIRVNRSP